MKIVFLDDATVGFDVSLDPIKALGDYTGYGSTPAELVLERAGDCDVLIVNKVKIGKAEIDGCKNLKLICEAATGTNNIDVAYAAQKGIPVKNVAGYSTESVLQVTYTLILGLLGQIKFFDGYVKSGDYSASGCFTEMSHPFPELDGKSMGVIGMGTIGSRVAQVAKAFKMNVNYFSTSGTNHCTEYPALSLEELLAKSDIISIHAPLNDRTNNLITYDKLCLMKKNAIIINMGRGGIVNEADLARAVDEGIIAGAGLDVYSAEPIPADHPYMKMKHKERMMFTPHVGWASAEARVRLVQGVADNIKTIL
ncbi:MAG: D-2-hydroxyacid dehydrogenase [Bacteroidales bacterium]|nr:D-2-hydroxyacid dehydrogenase [Bacteroidales bacterium]